MLAVYFPVKISRRYCFCHLSPFDLIIMARVGWSLRSGMRKMSREKGLMRKIMKIMSKSSQMLLLETSDIVMGTTRLGGQRKSWSQSRKWKQTCCFGFFPSSDSWKVLFCHSDGKFQALHANLAEETTRSNQNGLKQCEAQSDHQLSLMRI